MAFDVGKGDVIWIAGYERMEQSVARIISSLQPAEMQRIVVDRATHGRTDRCTFDVAAMRVASGHGLTEFISPSHSAARGPR